MEAVEILKSKGKRNQRIKKCRISQIKILKLEEDDEEDILEFLVSKMNHPNTLSKQILISTELISKFMGNIIKRD